MLLFRSFFRRYSIGPLALSVALSGIFLALCGGKTARVAERCAECLDFPEAKVCTTGGERINACHALCLQEVVLCYQKCPCPYSEDTSEDKGL